MSGCLFSMPMMPVWRSCTNAPDGLGGVDDLESIQRRRQRGQHLRLGHGQIHAAELHQRMAARQQVLGIDVGDRAGGRDVHVAAHQDRADGRSGLKGSGCFSSLTEPTPMTGMIPASANCGANIFTASSVKPLKTSGVSIGFR